MKDFLEMKREDSWIHQIESVSEFSTSNVWTAASIIKSSVYYARPWALIWAVDYIHLPNTFHHLWTIIFISFNLITRSYKEK